VIQHDAEIAGFQFAVHEALRSGSNSGNQEHSNNVAERSTHPQAAARPSQTRKITCPLRDPPMMAAISFMTSLPTPDRPSTSPEIRCKVSSANSALLDSMVSPGSPGFGIQRQVCASSTPHSPAGSSRHFQLAAKIGPTTYCSDDCSSHARGILAAPQNRSAERAHKSPDTDIPRIGIHFSSAIARSRKPRPGADRTTSSKDRGSPTLRRPRHHFIPRTKSHTGEDSAAHRVCIGDSQRTVNANIRLFVFNRKRRHRARVNFPIAWCSAAEEAELVAIASQDLGKVASRIFRAGGQLMSSSRRSPAVVRVVTVSTKAVRRSLRQSGSPGTVKSALLLL